MNSEKLSRGFIFARLILLFVNSEEKMTFECFLLQFECFLWQFESMGLMIFRVDFFYAKFLKFLRILAQMYPY